ncbi:hypothetical protein GGX14DRAFT_389315 [Mycena pura]|uniref:Uncharacterized protein n=1 Tax=Mycena pura TaxID=153505 RepID=A0AAD6YHX7_9AGAR|nr:hypothetical protein GGX14DRAFT_389315 [Mycena pura]
MIWDGMPEVATDRNDLRLFIDMIKPSRNDLRLFIDMVKPSRLITLTIVRLQSAYRYLLVSVYPFRRALTAYMLSAEAAAGRVLQRFVQCKRAGEKILWLVRFLTHLPVDLGKRKRGEKRRNDGPTSTDLQMQTAMTSPSGTDPPRVCPDSDAGTEIVYVSYVALGCARHAGDAGLRDSFRCKAGTWYPDIIWVASWIYPHWDAVHARNLLACVPAGERLTSTVMLTATPTSKSLPAPPASTITSVSSCQQAALGSHSSSGAPCCAGGSLVATITEYDAGGEGEESTMGLCELADKVAARMDEEVSRSRGRRGQEVAHRRPRVVVAPAAAPEEGRDSTAFDRAHDASMPGLSDPSALWQRQHITDPASGVGAGCHTGPLNPDTREASARSGLRGVRVEASACSGSRACEASVWVACEASACGGLRSCVRGQRVRQVACGVRRARAACVRGQRM